MNRSILIVICDFLLVSLLLFSAPDLEKVTERKSDHPTHLTLQTNRSDANTDLAAAMRLALNEERKSQQNLAGELERTRAEMSQREKEAQATREALQSQQKTSQRVQQEQAELQQRYTSAELNLESLNKQLSSTSAEAALSKEKLTAMESNIRKQTDDAATLKAQLSALERSNQVAAAEQQRLSSQLQVAEVERRHATEDAARMQTEVQVQREEKARLAQQNEKLAEGVRSLATNSGDLVREVRENRPLAPNTIFSDFVSNRVEARFVATRAGLLGDATKRKEANTILVSDGKNTYCLCHVQDTPLTLWAPGTDWEGLTGTIVHDGAGVPIRSIYFHLRDPRVVWIPLGADEARSLNCRIYKTSPDPFKFQDAVIIGTRESYYGECRFQIDTSAPDYLKLDSSFLKGLFGKFNPSRGDLVLSKTGELLGIMVNGTYCLMLKNFEASGTLQFASDTRAEHTGLILSQLYSIVAELPPKLQ
jgi:hypothetical protein